MFEGQRKSLDYIGGHRKGKGVFWVFGDSLSYQFYDSFSKNRREFCETNFQICNVSTNWIYPKTMYLSVESVRFLLVHFYFPIDNCGVAWDFMT